MWKKNSVTVYYNSDTIFFLIDPTFYSLNVECLWLEVNILLATVLHVWFLVMHDNSDLLSLKSVHQQHPGAQLLIFLRIVFLGGHN